MRQPSRELIYPSGLGTVVLRKKVIRTFSKFQQLGRTHTEAGGQLFAALTGERVEVVHATTGEKATRGRYFFHPNRKEEQQEIAAAFQKKSHFVGDWHTHPEPTPTPSSVDVRKASEIFKRSEHELNALLMIIVGTADFPLGLCVAWVSAAGITILEPEVSVTD